MSQELVTVKTVAKRFNFNCICGKEGLKRPILVENINRAGMELMGFFEHSDLRRIVVFGNKEINYILSHTYEELKKAGSRNAWLAIQKIDSSACIHRLYALEGAIQGIKKSELDPDLKKELKEFYLEYTKY